MNNIATVAVLLQMLRNSQSHTESIHAIPTVCYAMKWQVSLPCWTLLPNCCSKGINQLFLSHTGQLLGYSAFCLFVYSHMQVANA